MHRVLANTMMCVCVCVCACVRVCVISFWFRAEDTDEHGVFVVREIRWCEVSIATWNKGGEEEEEEEINV